MSREDGFAIADVDAGLLSDPKVVALARRLRDPVQTSACIGLYLAVVLESWSAGYRVTVDEALPAWWLDPAEAAVAHLIGVGLLDTERMVPEHSWDGWFGPAWDRREKRRQAGSIGGKASRSKPPKRRSSNAPASLNPTVPTDPSPSAEAEPCAACGGAVSADDATVREIEGQWRNVHRECPKANAA